MKKWLPRILGPIGFLVFLFAIYLLQKQLQNYTYHDILNTFRAIPATTITLAAALALTYYLVLGAYDVVAFKFINVPLKFRNILFTCFISNVLGNNTGYSMLFGGSIRYRLYSLYNISMLNVTKVLFFSSATIWLGLLAVGGAVFTFAPAYIEQFNFFFTSTRPIGIIFLSIFFVYFSLSFFNSRPIKFFKWKITFPGFSIVFWQTMLASANWILASLALYVLMPAGTMPYFTLLKIFLIAQLLGILSQVPGGVGVFESTIFLLMPQASSSPEVMGSLIAFRLVFYFFPLSVALLLLASHEFLRMRKKFQTASKIFGRRLTPMLPQTLTIAMFFAGVIILFTSFTPIEINQFEKIIYVMPPQLLDTLHFIASACAIGFLFVARGLELRIKKAYVLGICLLAISILTAILTQQPIKIAGLTIILAALIPAKAYFYRSTSILATKLNAWWLFAISGTFLMSVWVGFFVNVQDVSSWRHLSYFINTLLANTDSARFLRASVGIGALLVIVMLEQFFRTLSSKARVLAPPALDVIIKNSNKTYPHLALSGDKQFITSANGKSFLMYASSGLMAIALENPVGESKAKAELLWQFKEMCDSKTLRPSFIGIDGRYTSIYHDIGLETIKLGHNAELALTRFEGNDYFKNICAASESAGFSFKVIPPEQFDEYKDIYNQLNSTWLFKTDYVEMNFLPGAYKDYMRMYNFGAVFKNGNMVAFAIIAESAAKNEASVIVMRHDFSCENIIEYLMYNCVMWAKREGFKWFDLGMALSSADAEENLLLKRFARLFLFSEHFQYNVLALFEFKNKFNPVWQQRYLAANTAKFNFVFLKSLSSLIFPENKEDGFLKWTLGKYLKKPV
ncbi:MAG: phosphatidylglycerol lysyltransferase domain-containing protein [Elusimicrobia bacterium]|nr:phosphatidylglycerol lysyltransferase domain-containing protein [Elusimicrobiota bacterium]